MRAKAQRHSELEANLLMPQEAKNDNFSECALKLSARHVVILARLEASRGIVWSGRLSPYKNAHTG
jgi:hypothetical protein